MKENNIEEDIKIIEDFILKTDVDYSEYNEQIVGDISYQAIQHLLSEYKKALKETEQLKKENEELKNENDDLNKELNEENKRCMMLAVEKQDYLEKHQYHLKQNESLTKEFSDYIPIQKIKDKIEKEIKYHEKNILDIENITILKSKTAKEEAEIEFNKYAIVVLNKVLQELLESEEK